MRSKRYVLALAVLAMLAIAAGALGTAVEAARPEPQPGCNQYCKPFLNGPGGIGKCYFVGCDAEGDCIYRC